jgi:hypothetical protein
MNLLVYGVIGIFILSYFKTAVVQRPTPTSLTSTNKDVPFYAGQQNSPTPASDYVSSGSTSRVSQNLSPASPPETHIVHTYPAVFQDATNNLAAQKFSSNPEIMPIGVEQRIGWSTAAPRNNLRLAGEYSFTPVNLYDPGVSALTPEPVVTPPQVVLPGPAIMWQPIATTSNPLTAPVPIANSTDVINALMPINKAKFINPDQPTVFNRRQMFFL